MFDFSALETAELVHHVENCIHFSQSISPSESASFIGADVISEAADELESLWRGECNFYIGALDRRDWGNVGPSGSLVRKTRQKGRNGRPVPTLREMPEKECDVDTLWKFPSKVRQDHESLGKARCDRLRSREQRVAAYVNPKHATRMRGAARRRALSPSRRRRASYSEKELAIFGRSAFARAHLEYELDFDDHYDDISYYGYDQDMGDAQACENQIQAKLQQDSTLEYFGCCPICMDRRVLLELNCSHAFCMPCLLSQLAARWTGPLISFSYLQCGLCRQQLGHRELQVPMCSNLAFKEQVERLAANKFVEEQLHVLGSVRLTALEIRSKAMKSIATYMCSTCYEPFCSGRAECAQQINLSVVDTRCSQCEWNFQSGHAHDQRCMLHGHRSAIFKCDFCCSVATYRCGGNTNFCERCHRQAYSNIYFPCPGPKYCTLDIPHPCILNEQGEGSVRSFVLGCSACQGFEDANEGFSLGTAGEFGYREREWEDFTGGDMLIAALGEREVMDRLRLHHPDAVRSGNVSECAERLLLLELGVNTPEDLFSTQGGGQRDILARRLEAVGLSQNGSSADLARRLLLLRKSAVADLGHVDCQDDEADDEDLPPLVPLEQMELSLCN